MIELADLRPVTVIGQACLLLLLDCGGPLYMGRRFFVDMAHSRFKRLHLWDPLW